VHEVSDLADRPIKLFAHLVPGAGHRIGVSAAVDRLAEPGVETLDRVGISPALNALTKKAPNGCCWACVSGPNDETLGAWLAN
jgi:hypothetical protein